MITAISGFVLTYLAAGLALAGLARRLERSRGAEDDEYAPCQALFTGFGAAPLLISLILCALLLFFPRHSNTFYGVIIFVVFASIGLIGWPGMRDILRTAPRPLRLLLPQSLPAFFAAVLALVLVGRICHQAVFLPIHGHDALSYAFIGKYLYKEKSLDNYPMTKPDAETGAVIWKANHPPGLVGLYAWFHVVRGGAESDLLPRTVSPMYGIYLIALLLVQLSRRNASTAWAVTGVLCLLATPWFWFQGVGNGVDLVRGFFIIQAVFVFAAFIRVESISNLCHLLVALGFAYFLHRGSIVWIPLMLVGYVLMSQRLKWRWTCLAGLLVLIVVFGFYTHGRSGKIGELSFTPIDIEDVRRKFSFSDEWLEKVSSGRSSWLEIQWVERCQLLSRPSMLGFTFHLGLLGILILFLRGRLRRDDVAILSVCGLYAAVVLYKYYLNYRYIATLAPVACYFAAIGLPELCELASERMRLWLRRAATVLLATAIPLTVATFLFAGTLAASTTKARGEQSFVSRATAQADKFVNWKPRCHPIEQAMLFLRQHKTDPAPKSLFIAEFETNEAAYYYYLGGRHVLFFEDISEWNRLLAGRSDGDLKAASNVDFIVIDQTIWDKGVIKEANIAKLISTATTKPPVWSQWNLRIYLLPGTMRSFPATQFMTGQ